MAAQPLGEPSTASSPAGSAISSGPSHVRRRTGVLPSRAVSRVAEYLRVLGLADSTRLGELSEEIAASATGDDAEAEASSAVFLAQERFEAWRRAVFRASGPDPLLLRVFLTTFPALVLGDEREARRAALRFFDPSTGAPPRHTAFREQKLELGRLLRRVSRFALPGLTLLSISGLALGVLTHGIAWLWWLWAGLWLFLSLCGAIGLFTAVLGLFCSRAAKGAVGREAPLSAPVKGAPRTALVMPIYHESAEHVFAALAAMRESLLGLPEVDPRAFEIFALSDSRDPALAAEEERAFRRVSFGTGGQIPFYYRRRAQNFQHKAGNLAEFFERWGHRYEYAIVLDADSLMSGATLLELVRRMQAAPSVALLQAPIALRGGETLFARVIQFASSVFGPLFTRGFAAWSGAHGNYYGHNAIVRVKAFLDCCALPRLAGRPPLGGDILSHDFVEAALLCRAGWEVRMAPDLSGSFEGLPPSLSAYVTRDRRWCQGNMQHLRIAVARGLKPTSRLHLLLGACSYLESPAWLLFVGLGVSLGQTSPSPFVDMTWIVITTAAVLLLGPHLLGMVDLFRDQGRTRGHGGVGRTSLGFVLGLVLGAFIAPLILLYRTRIVASLLLGRSVRWGSQQREDASGFWQHARSEMLSTLLGVGLPSVLYFAAPSLLWWLSPVWIPWALSIPLVWLLSSRAAGAWTRRVGCFLVPSETTRDELLERAEQLRALTVADDAARFRDLVLDPVLLATHLARLDGRSGDSAEAPARLRERALRLGPAGLSPVERVTLANDPDSMRWLHREGWRGWPVESWQLARERAQIPMDSKPFAGDSPEQPDSLGQPG